MKDVLILVSGLFGSTCQWGYWNQKMFPEMHAIIPWALNGGYEDPDLLDNMSLSSMRNYLVDYIQTKCIDKGRRVHLVGHSAGGLLAMMVVHELPPQSIQNVAILAGNAPRNAYLHIPFRLPFLSLDLIRARLTGRSFVPNRRQTRFMCGDTNIHLHRESGLAVWQVLRPCFDVETLKKNVSRAIIAAEDDNILPRSYSKGLADFYGAQLRVVQGNHMFHADPRTYLDVIAAVRESFNLRPIRLQPSNIIQLQAA